MNQAVSDTPTIAAAKQQDLGPAIVGLFSDVSFEVTGRFDADYELACAFLAPGSRISVTWLPRDNHEQLVFKAKQIHKARFVPVPHIAARQIKSPDELDKLLNRLCNEAGVRSAFVIGGDIAKPQGPYSSALDVLRTGLFERRGFQTIGVTGYPEGHPAIPREILDQELRAKLGHIYRSGMESFIVSQLCFEGAPIAQWVEHIRQRHPAVPIRIGLAGPASLRTLTRYAMICGVRLSTRMLLSRGASLAKLNSGIGPEPIIRDLLQAHSLSDQTDIGIHLFPFGGFERTAKWASAIARGEFSVPNTESGFLVKSQGR